MNMLRRPDAGLSTLLTMHFPLLCLMLSTIGGIAICIQWHYI